MRTPWPTDLTFDSKAKALHISFDDGARFDIPFELLRIESPSAENKGHGSNPAPPPIGKANVGITRADAVGRYAVRISFDDGDRDRAFSALQDACEERPWELVNVKVDPLQDRLRGDPRF